MTEEEYESRGSERYDAEPQEKVGMDPCAMRTGENVAALHAYLEDQYEQLIDAAYKRRGLTEGGIATVERLRELGIDFPEILNVVRGGRSVHWKWR